MSRQGAVEQQLGLGWEHEGGHRSIIAWVAGAADTQRDPYVRNGEKDRRSVKFIVEGRKGVACPNIEAAPTSFTSRGGRCGHKLGPFRCFDRPETLASAASMTQWPGTRG